MTPNRCKLSIALAALAMTATLAGQAPAVASRVIDAPALLGDLKTLAADDMQGRLIGTAGGEKARTFVVTRFKASGIAPFGSSYLQSFTSPPRRGGAPGLSGVNVVGQVQGTRSDRRYIVLTAHYDHIGVRNGQVFNGADDNASGTAALFAVGAYFRAHPMASSLLVAAFDGEEEGLLGSRAFVQTLPVDRSAIVINVNVDMIGRDANNTLYAVGATRQPWLRPYIERVAKTAPVKLLIGFDGGRTGQDDWTGDSDQYSFLEAGIPALYLGVEDEEQHHKATDDYETMTYGFYAAAVETTIQMIEELDAHADAILAEPRRSVR